MSLRIPENHRLILTEYLCGNDHEFYVSQEPATPHVCPFCGGEAHPNGDIDIFTKRQHDAT